MCYVSRAIAPREPWRDSSLGHWYWDVPSYAHRYVELWKSFDKSGEELFTSSWEASGPTGSEAPQKAAQACERRWERRWLPKVSTQEWMVSGVFRRLIRSVLLHFLDPLKE